MILDWHSLQGKMAQDAALDAFEEAIEDYERAKKEYRYWAVLAWWARWYQRHKN